MKILVLLHGMPPQAGRTVVGSGLRAFANGEALRHLGHEVHYCTRAEDLPDDLRRDAAAYRASTTPGADILSVKKHAAGDRSRMAQRGPAPLSPEVATDPALQSIQTLPGVSGGLAPAGGPLGSPGNPWSFTESHMLHAVIRSVDPDAILVEAPEEARRLPDGRFSVILDLFAPRILEQQFQEGADERDAVRILDAVQRADHFVFSNERQKYFHLPLLALAGVDCTEDAGGVGPISCPPELPPFRKPEEPVFVAGGVFWPWADITDGLVSLLDILRESGRGDIHLYGGEYGIRSDTVRYSDPRKRLPGEDPQLHFKGLVPIDELWSDYSRGSVAFDLMAPNPEREINLSFRQIDYLRCGLPIITAPQQVIAPKLLEYGAGWTVEPGDVAALRALVRRLLEQPDLVAAASSAAQALARDHFVWTKTAGALQDYLDDPRRRRNQESFVARITRTQADLWEDHEENKRLRETVGHLHNDQGKKSDEIDRLNARISTLMGTVDRLTDSLGDVSRFKNDSVAYLHEQQDAALREAGELGRELERKALDVHKKQEALARANKEIDKLKASIKDLTADNEALEARYVSRDGEALDLEHARDRARGRADVLTNELSVAKRELEQKQAALQLALEQQADVTAERDALKTRVESALAELAIAKAEAIKKHRALGEAARERERLEAEFLLKLDRAESAAHELLEEARDRIASALSERGKLRSRLDEAEHRLREAERRSRSLHSELMERTRAAEDAYHQWEKDRRAITEEAEQSVVMARAAADEARLERDDLHKELVEKQTAYDGLKLELSASRKTIADTLAERDSIRADFERAKAEIWETATQQTTAAQREVEDLKDRLMQGAQRVADLEADADKKQRALAEAGRERDRLQALFVLKLEQAEEAARGLLESERDRALALETDRGRVKARLEETREELRNAERELKAKDAMLLDAQHEREALISEQDRQARETWLQAQRQIDKAHKAVEGAQEEALKARSRVADLEADIQRKNSALSEAEKERIRAETDFLSALERAEAKARSLLEETRSGLEERLQEVYLNAERDLSSEREQRKALEERVNRDVLRIEELTREVEKQSAELREQQLAAAEAAVFAEKDRLRLAEEAESRVQIARAQAEESRKQRDDAREQLFAATTLVSDLQADVDKKTTALESAQLERSRLQSEFLAGMDRAESQARLLLEETRDQHERRVQEVYLAGQRELATERQRRVAREEELARATLRIEDLSREADRLSAELRDHERAAAEAEKMWQEDRLRITDEAENRIQIARNQAEDARRQRDTAREELFLVHSLVEDLQADVDKKTEAIEKAQLERSRLQSEFLANLERAEGSANTLLEEARDRISGLSEERGRLMAFVEELEHRAKDLERNLSSKETSLELSEQKLRSEHANFEEGMLELQRLRQTSTESRGRVAELEADAIRQQSALESLSGELARTSSQLEQSNFELEELRDEVGKKGRELAEAQAQRDQAHEQVDTVRQELEAELEAARTELGRLAARAEKADYEVKTLRTEVTKKTAELGEAHKQRDALNTEKEDLHRLLTIASGGDPDAIQKAKKKKKKGTGRAEA